MADTRTISLQHAVPAVTIDVSHVLEAINKLEEAQLVPSRGRPAPCSDVEPVAAVVLERVGDWDGHPPMAFEAYVDGSASPEGASGGCVVLAVRNDRSRQLVTVMSGPVALQGCPLWIGATAATNNTAELSAAAWALRWALLHVSIALHIF